MKWLHLCAVVALCAAAAFAQTVTGKWTGPGTTSDNGIELTFALTQAPDGSITGYATGGHFNERIVGGSVEGNRVTLQAERPGRNGNMQKVTLHATLEGGRLKIEVPARGRPQVFELTRVSTAAPAPLPPRPALVSLPMPAPVKYNGLAKTPQMGWNSWNRFRNQVSDKMVREIADAMVSTGMRDAGYIYVNIDDTWEGAHRDANGNITTNNKFPDMKALADYVHSKGLKLGIYSSPGPTTCAGYEGSYQHEVQDAKTFAAWGIDYLKYDWCGAREVYDTQQSTMAAAYAKMGNALLKSGRKIFYSLCQYGMNDVDVWGARAGGNSWRTTGDIRDSWQSMSNIGFNLQTGREKYAGPGHWNDPDMLEIGNGGMNDDEYKVHMSLWCMLSAPLLAGNDIRDMKSDIAAILMNKEVIAIDQDKLGKQAVAIAKEGDTQVWARQLAGGGHAVGLFNLGDKPAKVTAKWSDIGITGSHSLRELWKHEDLGRMTEAYTAEVPSHGVVLIRIAK